MTSLFDFKDYRVFLKSALPVKGPERGARNRLAEALRCQKGFVSQVLSGRSHFSLEHGIKISRFLGLGAVEEEYFLLMLHRDRAGSKDLEKFYDKKLSEILDRRKEIKERIRSSSDLSEQDQMIYYSSWHYTAVHMCLLVPELQTRASMSAFLGVQPQIIAKVLDFFLQVGLAQQRGDHFTAGPTRIHLPSDSPLIAKHHTNWRMRAIDSLDAPKEQDLHYSLIMSISDQTAEKIRDLLLNAIQAVEPVMKESEDKAVYSLCLDLFSVRQGT